MFTITFCKKKREGEEKSETCELLGRRRMRGLLSTHLEAACVETEKEACQCPTWSAAKRSARDSLTADKVDARRNERSEAGG
jgi:hypothetical protein